MTEQIYKQLCQTMSKRGGMYPGMDIPEFYPLAKELFTPDEALLSNALPRGYNSIDQRAGIPTPPADHKALKEAIRASASL